MSNQAKRLRPHSIGRGTRNSRLPSPIGHLIKPLPRGSSRSGFMRLRGQTWSLVVFMVFWLLVYGLTVSGFVAYASIVRIGNQ